ncbi:uncharacterized protein LOC128387805 [Panonychus citri]|uniref:uncharacterized protein LOC128387805 n=1 Tax=Panonychus citri TaxID=50023 RepID=UPI0023074DC7|nr:uncharacterized protein LOC128387805 [Panonychus citri]
MSEDDIKNLFTTPPKSVTIIERIDDGKAVSENSQNHQTVEKTVELDTNLPVSQNVADNDDLSKKEMNIHEKRKLMEENIHDQLDELKRKKIVLPEFDATGLVLRKVIDTMSSMYDFVCEKYNVIQSSLYEIPIEDKTYKNEEKNQIFLEGILELPLDKYAKAMKFAKPKNPKSLAYQLVKLTFPKIYYENVSLGKKYYSHEELNSFKSSFMDDKNCGKFPLAFVLGFKNPLLNPFDGDFDPKLGQKRVEIFLDHIFRKSGYKKYSDEDLSQVRQRIMRILGFLNKEKKTSSGVNEVEDEEFENENEDSVHHPSYGNFEILDDEIFQ